MNLCPGCASVLMRLEPTLIFTHFAEEDECENPLHMQNRELRARVAELERQLLDRPHSNRKGEGAHYAKEMTSLGRAHKLCLEILFEKEAWDYESGFSLRELWEHVRARCLDLDEPVPTKQGLSGRLSELQGMGLIKSARNKVRLEDSGEMRFRFEGPNRWFLVSNLRTMDLPGLLDLPLEAWVGR